VESWLLEHGAILFRGFGVSSASEFESFARAVSDELIAYGERSSPRTQVSSGVYSSTDHPADQHIRLHNEQSYTLNWPMKIMFFCEQPAQYMGRTPIADSRKVYGRLSPRLVESFAARQVMYVRNYGDGLGLPWQEVFQTASRSVVEEHCREAGIEVEWKSGDRLRTRQVRPAVRRHPATGAPLWFNHAFFFHVSSLDPAVRDSMLAVVGEEDLPFNTFYGDGSPFEEEVLGEIGAAYGAETVSFPWERGDILLLDNMLTSHGREPFVGPRKILAAMADPFMSTYPEATAKNDG
ncbi:MAG TPA: TauD/TfdA family dioxygenase, partial [Pyrinomonadaceae bacterium]